MEKRLARNGVTIDRSEAAVRILDSQPGSTFAAFSANPDGVTATILLRQGATRYEIAHELKHYADWLSDRAAYVAVNRRIAETSPGVYKNFLVAQKNLARETIVYDGFRSSKLVWDRLSPAEKRHAVMYIDDVKDKYNMWKKYK